MRIQCVRIAIGVLLMTPIAGGVASGQLTTYNPPVAAPTSFTASGLNSSRVVVGSYSTAINRANTRGYFHLPNEDYIVYDYPAFNDDPANTATSLVGYNDRGYALGQAQYNGVRSRPGESGTPFYLYGGVATPIMVPGAASDSYALATGLNNNNTVCGQAFRGDGTILGSFLVNPDGSGYPFNVNGSTETRAVAINDLSQVVGSYLPLFSTFRLFLRNPDGSTVDLVSTIPGFTLGSVTGINNAGLIVGTGESVSGRAVSRSGYLRRPDGSLILFNVPGAYSTEVSGISNSGEVTGTWSDVKSNIYGYVGTPSLTASSPLSVRRTWPMPAGRTAASLATRRLARLQAR